MTVSVAGITAKIIHDDKWHAATSTHSLTNRDRERERHCSEIEPDRNAQTAENCVCLSIGKSHRFHMLVLNYCINLGT